MQVKVQYEWDRRAHAYLAAFYGNQLRRGSEWKDIRKVIGINILGGGTNGQGHWRSTPEQYERHYKFQEQIHKKICERYIDGIELLQFSVMNAPDNLSLANRDKQDRITYFKRASRMNQEEVKSHIQTPAVLKAFEMATYHGLLERSKPVATQNNPTTLNVASRHG